MAAIIGCDQRQNRDSADDREEVGENEAHQRDDRDEGKNRPEERLIPLRRRSGTRVRLAEKIARADAHAPADVAHDVVMQRALEASAPEAPIRAPLISLLVARLLPLTPPFAALLAPFAMGFAARGTLFVAAMGAVPAVAAGRLGRFRVVGRKFFADADSDLCHVLTP